MSGSTNRAGNRILAIDGPAGAGKSTVAARMAEQFGLLNIETGAMYRAFALKALSRGTALDDPSALTELSRGTAIELAPGGRVLLDELDVTDRLRAPAVSVAASRVSVHAPVRAWLVRQQQALGVSLPPGAHGLVMEGRDIGTVVFPEAGIKVFLHASPEARGERRLAQSGGTGATPQAVVEAIRERDERDSSRQASPLRPADDAVSIDSTALTLNEVVERVAALVRERWGL